MFPIHWIEKEVASADTRKTILVVHVDAPNGMRSYWTELIVGYNKLPNVRMLKFIEEGKERWRNETFVGVYKELLDA